MSMINRIDVRAGKLTYSQRITLGKIMQVKGAEEHEVFAAMLGVLNPELEVDYGSLEQHKYFAEILSGLIFWIERENNDLKGDPPDDDMKAAGFTNMVEKGGDFLVIKALAEKFSTDPDTVLTWEYGKVFAILYTDLIESQYRKKLQKIKQRKEEIKNKSNGKRR